MTILECMKEKGIQIEVGSLKRYQSVDVSFINAEGNEDETEFDVSRIGTRSGDAELSRLYADFCKENHISASTVLSVAVVKSANTYEALNAYD